MRKAAASRRKAEASWVPKSKEPFNTVMDRDQKGRWGPNQKGASPSAKGPTEQVGSVVVWGRLLRLLSILEDRKPWQREEDHRHGGVGRVRAREAFRAGSSRHETGALMADEKRPSHGFCKIHMERQDFPA